jgi:hypothetical protein
VATVELGLQDGVLGQQHLVDRSEPTNIGAQALAFPPQFARLVPLHRQLLTLGIALLAAAPTLPLPDGVGDRRVV